MPSRFADARDAVTALWLALTPASGNGYTAALTDSELMGDFCHRTFMHGLPSAPEIIEQDNDTVTLEYRWLANLRLSETEYNFDTAGEAVADEALAFWGAVNMETTWPAGVRHVRTEGGYTSSVDEEAGQISIVFELRALIQEEI